MATQIYLVRHGQTGWNAEGRLCGSSDVPLSEEGFAQARRLANRLVSVPLDAIYSSPLLRARQTAELIASLHGLPVILESALREVDYGDWEGLAVATVANQFPEQERLRREDPLRFVPPNGEPMAAFAQRVIAAIQRLANSHPNQTVCVVAHQTVNRFILCWVLQMDFSRWRQLRQDPACVNLLLVQGEGLWRVSLINDTVHLADLTTEQKNL